MAHDTAPAPALSFSGATFAKLAPGSYLQAHLTQSASIRPSGRRPGQFRQPTINKGSLSHCNGSAVVRLGDTAVVCGIRGEILKAADIPNPPDANLEKHDVVQDLGLVVPNLELSTGCSPAHLPGNPPSTLAQSLSHRIRALIRDVIIIDSDSLRITYDKPNVDDDSSDESMQTVTIAYWTLYVDIVCLALDGNAFDAAWLAVIAALQDTTLPRAWWDSDREAILCSPLTTERRALALRQLPLASTFAVYTTDSPLKRREEAEHWVLADPDSFEEAICQEVITIVLDSPDVSSRGLMKIEKLGGRFVGKELLNECIHASRQRWTALQASLKGK